jgi:hypothetical protein
MNIKTRFEKLYEHSFSPSSHVLTIYLNTESINGKKPEWKIRLKNGLKKLKEYLEADGQTEQLKLYHSLQKKVEKVLEDNKNDMKNGLILVASPDENFWFMEKLQIPVPNAFYWSDKPHVEEMDELLAEYGSTAILLVSGEEVTVLDTFLGDINNEWHLEWEMEEEDWREYKGVSHRNREASSTNQKDKYEKRYEVNQQRWLKNLSPLLIEANKEYRWERIIISGEDQLVKELDKELHFENKLILNRNIKGKPHHLVLQEVYNELEALEEKKKRVG